VVVERWPRWPRTSEGRRRSRRRSSAPTLGLDRQIHAAELDDEIDFGAFSIPEEREPRDQAAVDAAFQDLRDDPRLEQRAPQRMIAKLVG
jgi:hypothetical protein